VANLLLVTGSELNLIKLNKLQDDVMVTSTKIYKMQGISDKLVDTLGSTILTVSLDDESYKTEFQVVDSSFPIDGDGILGNPFLRANKLIIDVGRDELTSKSEEIHTIPARCELIIQIQVDTYDKSGQNVLIHAQELDKNILCGNVLNIIKNNQILINVMNPTEISQEILIPKLTDLSHEVFDLDSINNTRSVREYNNTENRLQILKDTLSCDHMNHEEKEMILEHAANMQTFSS
jgi:hypothetical protein